MNPCTSCGTDHIHQIIVPLDGSHLAETVLPTVEALATAMSLGINLVRAYTPMAYDRRYRYALAVAGQSSLKEEIRDTCERYLETAANNMRANGIQVKTTLLIGPAAPAIVEYIRDSPEDIVIMASHGRSGFWRLLLGSITEAVVRSSGDPVLIVPPTT